MTTVDSIPRHKGAVDQLRVVTTLYLKPTRHALPAGLRRLVIVVFAIGPEGRDTLAAYGVDPDGKEVVFRFTFEPARLLAVLEVLLLHLVGITAIYRHLKKRDAHGRLSFRDGKMWLEPAESAPSHQPSYAWEHPPVHALLAGPPPADTQTVVIPGRPPEDTGPKAVAVAVTIAAVADLTEAAAP